MVTMETLFRKEKFAKRIFLSFVNMPRTLVTFHADVLKLVNARVSYILISALSNDFLEVYRFCSCNMVMKFSLHPRLPLSYTILQL